MLFPSIASSFIGISLEVKFNFLIQLVTYNVFFNSFHNFIRNIINVKHIFYI